MNKLLSLNAEILDTFFLKHSIQADRELISWLELDEFENIVTARYYLDPELDEAELIKKVDSVICFLKKLSNLIDDNFDTYSISDQKVCESIFNQITRSYCVRAIFEQLKGRMLLNDKLFNAYVDLWGKEDLDRPVTFFMGRSIVPKFSKTFSNIYVEKRIKETEFAEKTSNILKKEMMFYNSYTKFHTTYCKGLDFDLKCSTKSSLPPSILNFIAIYFSFYQKDFIPNLKKNLNKEDYLRVWTYFQEILSIDITLGHLEEMRSLLLTSIHKYQQKIESLLDKSGNISETRLWLRELENKVRLSGGLYLIDLVKDERLLPTILDKFYEFLPPIFIKTLSYFLLSTVELFSTQHEDY